MRRIVPVVVLALALPAGSPAALDPLRAGELARQSSGTDDVARAAVSDAADSVVPALAFVAAPAGAAGSLVVAGADGAGLRMLAPGLQASAPAWSADGSRIAFVAGGDVHVVAADGSGLRRLTELGPTAWAIAAAWSPDGSRLAFLRREQAGSDVWEVLVDGSGGARRLTRDGGYKSDPLWLSEGTLLYASQTALSVLDTASGAVRSLGGGSAPSLSPDRRWIAFLAAGAPAPAPTVWVMRPEGSGRHRVSLTYADSTGALWSPDGSRLAFTGVRIDSVASPRFGTPHYRDVHVVGADGADERRVTGFPGAENVLPPDRIGSSVVGWWPDGSRLFFTRRDDAVGAFRLHVMNADGSCGQPFDVGGGIDVAQPAWRPGASPRLPALECADLWLTGGRSRDAVGRGLPLELAYSLANVGNRTATGVRVTFAEAPIVEAASASQGSCSAPEAACALGTLAPGATARLSLRIRAGATAAGLHVVATAATAERDPARWNDAVTTGVQVLPCTIVGTWGPDRLVGTPGRDEVCGRPGADYIDGRAGDDFLDGGSGEDRIVGGPGRDVILGGGGSDAIFAFDGRPDDVTCGSERDVVVADARDSVHRGCEVVIRTIPCERLGTFDNDTLLGNPKRDAICALPGHDTVRGRAGPDAIDGGSGNDTIDGGRGRDLLLGGQGFDVILARDGERDTIRCGPQTDTVVADRLDIVGRDCERVLRR